MKKRSIQLNIIVSQLLLQGAMIACVSVLIYQFVARQLVEQFDFSLEQTADAATKLIELELEGGRLYMEIEDDYVPNIDLETTYQQIWNAEAVPVYGSTNLAGDQKWLHAALVAQDNGEKVFGGLELPDGRSARYCLLPFQPYVDDGAVVEMEDWTAIAVREMSSIAQPLADIKQGCIGFAAIAMGLSVVANLLVAYRGFRPLRQIAAQVDVLDVENPASRVEVKKLPVELAPMVEKLNGMLSRVEEQWQRERRFSGNVAHELRTPLAEMKMISEVGAQWKPEYLPGDDPRSYFNDAGEVAKDMQSLLETLLAFSRGQNVEIQKSVVDVNTLLSEVVRSVNAPGRSIHWDAGAALFVDSDPALLKAVVRNLIANAVDHSVGGIELSVAPNGICVSNDAGSLEDADLQHLTEPFWQKDAARTNRQNCGLGLSLVEKYCRVLGLKLTFSITQDKKFVACIVLPDARGVEGRSA